MWLGELLKNLRNNLMNDHLLWCDRCVVLVTQHVWSFNWCLWFTVGKYNLYEEQIFLLLGKQLLLHITTFSFTK